MSLAKQSLVLGLTPLGISFDLEGVSPVDLARGVFRFILLCPGCFIAFRLLLLQVRVLARR
jgi:hypothetical protein